MNESKRSLKPIGSKSRREQTVDILREAILLGELKPGEQLIETDLSERLGVSRAPIREALQILNKEGLVEIVPYHGTSVRKLTKRDIEELYSMRILLETFAVRRLIVERNPEHIHVLRAIYDDMLQAANAQDMKRMNMVDRVFHTSLINLCNHTLLSSMWQPVTMKVRQIMALRTVHNTDIMGIAHSHLPIIEAIAATDEAAAIPLIEKHIVTAGYLIVEDWNDDNDAKD